MSVGSSLSIMATLTVLSYMEYSFKHPTVKRSKYFPWIHILFILLNVVNAYSHCSTTRNAGKSSVAACKFLYLCSIESQQRLNA